MRIGIEINYTVDVVAGPRTSNMTEWDHQDSGNVAAHEFRHMMGLYDEHSGRTTEPGGELIDPSSIMGSTGGGATPYSRHLEGFQTWIAGHSPEETFRLERSPEPATRLIAMSTLVPVALRRRAGRCGYSGRSTRPIVTGVTEGQPSVR